LQTKSTTRHHYTGATDNGAEVCDVRTALGVTTATPKRRLGCSGTAVVKGELRDAEQEVDICDNEFHPQGSIFPTDGERCLISHALFHKRYCARRWTHWPDHRYRAHIERREGQRTGSTVYLLLHCKKTRKDVQDVGKPQDLD